MFFNNFLTDVNYSFKIVIFENFCIVNPEDFELCDLSTVCKCPIFPKYGYNREMELKFLINIDTIKIDNALAFDRLNSLKSIYICNKDLTSIFKFSNIKLLNMQYSAVFDNILEITSTIDVSNCDMVNDEDDTFLIKTLVLSRC